MVQTTYLVWHALFKFSHIPPFTQKSKIKKIKTFPYLPTHKLKNKSETDLFFSRPKCIENLPYLLNIHPPGLRSEIIMHEELQHCSDLREIRWLTQVHPEKVKEK